MQVSAALRRFGSSPPRALRNTAILLRLTLRVVIGNVGEVAKKSQPRGLAVPGFPVAHGLFA
jgi:hypothetical protein